VCDREREGRKEEDPAGGLATGLGGRSRRTGRPRSRVGDVPGKPFSSTHTVENPFSPWVSEILALLSFG
jgi:hypothetical protein